MGAVNNLSELVEEFDGADNESMSLLCVSCVIFPPPPQSVEHHSKGCCMVTVQGVLSYVA